jgi:hypothetical protein
MSFFSVIVFLNLLWFGAAFRYFTLTPNTAAKLLVPQSARNSPLFSTVSATVRFIGGFNLAFAVLSLLLLIDPARFPLPGQNAVFAIVFAVAHGSQFACNVPILKGGGRQGESLWDVRKGPMLFIFVVDFVLMVANGVAAGVFLNTK